MQSHWVLDALGHQRRKPGLGHEKKATCLAQVSVILDSNNSHSQRVLWLIQNGATTPPGWELLEDKVAFRALDNGGKRNSKRNSHVHPRHDLSSQTGNSSLRLTENTANLKGRQVMSTGVPRSREGTFES